MSDTRLFRLAGSEAAEMEPIVCFPYQTCPE
jgi:hypothetical protein